MTFIAARNQDATDVIRGFHYQLQVTLARWLELGEEEFLYLECGEDVDRVLRDEKFRVLEQVKNKAANLTLRSADAVTAIANFASHLRRNPGQALSFRYTTIASAGRERPSSLKARGVDTWNAISQAPGRLSAEHAENTKGLWEILKSAKRPKKCPDDSWSALEEVLCKGPEAQEFTDLIRGLEWSVSEPDLESRESQLVALIEKLLGSDDRRLARAKYDQIRIGLIDVMSTPGEKRLDRRLLQQKLAEPTLAAEDRDRLRFLEGRVEASEEAIATLQEALSSHGLQAVPLVFGDAEVTSRLNAVALPGTTPLVDKAVIREKTLTAIAVAAEDSRWLHIHGVTGIGKSNLACLAAGSFGGVAFGLGLRGIPTAHVEQVLAGMLARTDVRSAVEPSQGSVVLIDDLPQIDPRGRLEALVRLLVATCEESEKVLITTSPSSLPSSVMDSPPCKVYQVASPAFTTEEAMELLTVHGAECHADVAVAVNAACKGHPVLLTALARHVVESRLALDRNELMRLLQSRSHREVLDVETMTALLQTVERDDCRRLLYRLAAFGAPLGTAEIRKIATVHPQLSEAGACVAALQGLWMQADSQGRFKVSPLVETLGQEIPEDEQRATHYAGAKAILDRDSIEPIDVLSATLSLRVAREDEEAATLLLQAAFSHQVRSLRHDAFGLLLHFPPGHRADLTPSTELLLRAVQASAAMTLLRDEEPYIESLRAINLAADQRSAVSAFGAGASLLTADPPPRTSTAILACELFKHAESSDELPSDLRKLLTQFAQMPALLIAFSVRSWEDLSLLENWLIGLDSEEIAELSCLDSFQEVVRIALMRPLWDDTGQLVEHANRELAALEASALCDTPLMFGPYASCAQIIASFESGQDVESAVDIHRRARARYEARPAAIVALDGTLANQLILAGRSDEGLRLGLAALRAKDGALAGVERATCVTQCLVGAWPDPDADTQNKEVLSYIASELRLGLERNDVVLAEAQCQQYSQLACVDWMLGHVDDAADSLESALSAHLGMPDSLRYRQLGAGLAHAMTYVATVAESGEPPAECADGSPFLAPSPTMFHGQNSALAQMWRARDGHVMLMWQMGRLRCALGQAEEGLGWLDRAWELGETRGSAAILVQLGLPAAYQAAKAGMWPYMLSLSISSGRAKATVNSLEGDVFAALADDFDFDPNKPLGDTELEDEATLWAVYLVTVATAFVVVPLAVSDRSSAVLKCNELLTAIDGLGESNARAPWRQIVEPLRAFAEERLTKDRLSSAISATELESTSSLAHVLLALHPDTSMKQSATSLPPGVWALLKHASGSGIDGKELLESMGAFWTEALKRAPFYFRSPKDLDDELSRARGLGSARYGKIALIRAADSVGAQVGEDVRSWLSKATEEG